MMKKSLSSTAQQKFSQRRTSSMSKMSIDEFSSYSQQLSILTEELATLKKEKEALIEYNQQLTKTISECKSENQLLVSNHEKLHNETRNINKFTSRFEKDRVLNSKSVRENQDEIFKIEREIEEHKEKKESLEQKIKKENKIVVKLQEVIIKMRNELTMQEKDREKHKVDANCTQKQILQMEEKVESLKISNINFMKKIKTSIINSTNLQ